MSVEINRAWQDYESAKEALMKIVRDITAARSDVDTAQAALEKLIDDYVDKVKQDIDSRTQQYTAFIAELNGVLDSIGRDSPLEGVQQIKAIVDGAAAIVNPNSGADQA